MLSPASRLAALVACVSLCLSPLSVYAAPGPGSTNDDAPREGPAPSTDPPVEGEGEDETSEPPPPSVVDPPIGIPVEEAGDEPAREGVEFAVPPPEAEADEVEEPMPTISFPDPGMAPSDGNTMLVLGGTTIALTLVGVGTAAVVGVRRGTPLEWLLPSTIVPGVGLLAFGSYGLYLGIDRAVAYRRWEIGYRVIGTPQGGGLTIGGSFALLGAFGFGAVGYFALRDGYVDLGATLLAIGGASGVAMPIMFVIGARRARAYQRTGGWRRRPVPPLPAGAEGAHLRPRIAPFAGPLRGGASFGVSGRF